MNSNPEISIISPVYRAEKIVDELVHRIRNTMLRMEIPYEIILVEDGSPDGSWEKIAANASLYPEVKGIKFSRNFGQHYAITAGIRAAQGNYCVILDCDLQDNPDYIPELYARALAGNDIVFTTKKKRKHSILKNLSAGIFFKIFNYLTENKTARADSTVGNYSLLSRKAIDAFCQIKDTHRHYLMVLRILGFKTDYLEIKHDDRFEGKSSYTFSKLVAHAINGITSQSDKLLRISITVGFSCFALSILWVFTLLILYFTHGLVPGYTSLMAVILLSTGLILMSIGIAGIYIGKIFEQVKERPLYFIDTKVNFPDK
jgi:polyisoprenyl-phosphate glycosyltransferase